MRALAAGIALLGAGVSILTAPAVQADTVIRLRPVAAATRHLEHGHLSRPIGVFYDSDADEIWVADSGNGLLGVFRPDGTPLFATSGGGTLQEPAQVEVDPDGDLWILTIDRTRLVHLNWRGDPLPPPILAGLPESPSIGAITLDEAGNLYVGENNEGRIHVYDRQLRPWFRFGSHGRDEGQFAAIVDIAVIGDWIAVVDAIGRPVQLFTRQGEYVRSWGEHAIGAQNFSLPQGVTIDSRQRVIVVDALRQEIKFFDIEGAFLGRFGGLGRGPGQVAYPSDVVADGAGRLFVAERGNSRVQVFAIEEMDVPAPKPSSPRRRRPSRRR